MYIRIARLAGCALLAGNMSPVLAQTVAGENSPPGLHGEAAKAALDEIVITGVRASLATAQEIKREKLEISDSVVASDISKLPDFNVNDALSRITGVQILRDRGEGGGAGGAAGVSGVSIRGLTQMETLLNGREAFSAGNGRGLDFADFPSEMLAGIDVYKTSSAAHIEGGVAGMVDLRTHRPFDFNGPQIAASVRQIHGSLAGESKSQFSTLLSNRWNQPGGKQFGALLNLAYQERAWREDQKSTGSPVARSNIVDGQTVIVPNGTSESASAGLRKRTSGALVLQWQPSDTLDLYAEGSYAELQTQQNTSQISATAPNTFAAGSAAFFPGSSDLRSITWINASATTAGAARDTVDRTMQLAAGGSWSGEALRLKGDLSYTKSFNSLMYSALAMNGAAATLRQDLSGNIPLSSAGGSGLTDLAGFTTAGIWYASRPFDGDLKAASFDGEYPLTGGILEALAGGVRIARRHATDAPGQVVFFPATVPAANAASLAIGNPYSDFLPGSTSIGNYLVADPAAARRVTELCGALGIACAIPASNPLGAWDIAEDTQAGYVMGKFKVASLPLDGNAGLRAVRTRESVSGSQGPAAGPFSPVNLNSTYTDFLPSANLRYEIGKGLYLRGAASKTLTRQDFNQMSPSLTLNPVQLSGTAGNPELRPVRADNLDFAVEKYFDGNTFIHATAFLKKVDGFVLSTSNPETYGGVVYQVSRPRNLNTAHVRGLELGYQQFYDFLPGWMKGLGLQANYTYVDSSTHDAILKQDVPLTNLSMHSGNLVGMYERGDVSARIAYNWRGKFMSRSATVAGAATPVFIKPYGWMDASLGYRVSKEVALALEVMNLLDTRRSSYYGVETRPDSVWANDRQISLTLTARF